MDDKCYRYDYMFVLISIYVIFIGFLQTTGCKPITEEQISTYFEKGVAKGVLDNDAIREASGLVMSVNNPGKLWIHNDSGDEARLFLIDDSARCQTTVHLPRIKNRDWEDITLGPGPLDGLTYIYIGDIGDNNAKYPSKYVYRLVEPVLTKSCKDTSILQVDTIELIFEDGPRDAEALIIDHKTRDLYLFSKRETNINLYKLVYPYSTSRVNITEKILKLPFTQVVAADWSKDRKELVVKTYRSIYYWIQPFDTSLIDILQSPAYELDYIPEPQGEAIAWSLSGDGYYTISERTGFARPVLYYYKRK